MVFFKKFRSNYKRAEVQIIIRTCFEKQQNIGRFPGDPGLYADHIVNYIWGIKGAQFDGEMGYARPNKFSIASFVLSEALKMGLVESRYISACLFSLGELIDEVHGFEFLDMAFRLEASNVFNEFTAETSGAADKPTPNPQKHTYEDWESWYTAYKTEAHLQNAALVGQDGELSFIDMMDIEPLKRAFRDGVEPQGIAKEFAQQFDILDLLYRADK